MVRGVLNLLHREIRGLHEAAYLLAFFTLGSQVMALIRDRLLAHEFGAGPVLDVFYAAFRIPDTIYALLASIVSLFVLIPFLEGAMRRGKDEVRRFMSDMFTFFSCALAFVAVVAWVAAPALVSSLYPGFSDAQHAELLTVTRVLLLQPLLLGVSNLFAAYVQVTGRFLLYAIAPILYNIGIIIGVLFFYPVIGIAGLGWGVVLGALMHVGIQVPYVIKEKVVPSIRMPDFAQVRNVILLSIPRSLTLASQQIVLLVLVSLASLYATGSISALSFAWNLQAVPLAIIGASYSVAAFPKLAKLFGAGDKRAYSDLVVTAARQIIFWALPATVLFIVLRAQFVRVVLGSGAFDWEATMLTSAFLALFVVSLVAQGLIVLLVRGCYAAGTTWIPLVLNLGSAVFTVTLALYFIRLAETGFFELRTLASVMRVEGIDGVPVLLLAAAFSMGAFVNAALLLLYYELMFQNVLGRLWRTAGVSLLASLAAGIAAYGSLNILDDVVNMTTLLGIFLQGMGAALVGVLAWLLALVACGSADLAAAWAAMHARVTRRRLESTRGSLDTV